MNHQKKHKKMRHEANSSCHITSIYALSSSDRNEMQHFSVYSSNSQLHATVAFKSGKPDILYYALDLSGTVRYWISFRFCCTDLKEGQAHQSYGHDSDEESCLTCFLLSLPAWDSECLVWQTAWFCSPGTENRLWTRWCGFAISTDMPDDSTRCTGYSVQLTQQKSS